MNHQAYLQQAVQLALDNSAEGQGGPFGALIVKGDQVLSTGVNQVTALADPTAHAEIMAIRAACQRLGSFQLTDCVLYSSCEPCPMCLGAIYWARLKAVYFACSRDDAAAAQFDDSFIYQEINQPASQRHIPMQHLAIANACQPFLQWQALSNKRCY